MNILEQFLLKHPDLMNYRLPEPNLAISNLFFSCLCIFFCLIFRFEDKEKKYIPVPFWSGNCWRFCWLFGAIACLIEAYGFWQNSAPHKSNSVIEVICLCSWAMLFIAGNFGILKSAFRYKSDGILRRQKS